MNRGPRVLVALALFLMFDAARAQIDISFSNLDANGDGALDRGEFGALPGRYADPQRFADLDRNDDLRISPEEWLAGASNPSGVPVGSLAPGEGDTGAEALESAGPAFFRHASQVPPRRRVAPPLQAPPDNPPPLTGHAGASGVKRGMTPRRPPSSGLPALLAPH